MDYRRVAQRTSGLLELGYQYDSLGSLSQLDDLLDGASGQDFLYDEAQRLISATGSYGQQTFRYDAIGNRLGLTEQGHEIPYVYADGRLSAAGDTSMDYDAVGNLIRKGSDQFTYNQASRLTKVQVESGLYEYGYNALGQRVIKTTPQSRIHYHYGPNGQLLAESDAHGQILTEYVYVNGERLALFDRQANLYYMHTNHLDAPLALSDPAGSLVWQAVYKPFGEVTVVQDNISVVARMPGQYADDETGFYYNYYRDYDPTLGRYLQSDPIGILHDFSDPQLQLAIRQGIPLESKIPRLNHLYGYAEQNPVKYSDPFGLLVLAVRIELSDMFWVVHVPDDGDHSCDVRGDAYDGFEVLGIYEINNPPCNFLCYFGDSEWAEIEYNSNPYRL